MIYSFQFFVVIWLRYECSKSDERFENCAKYTKMAYCCCFFVEELDARKAMLNTGTSFKQGFNSLLICSSYLQLLEKVENTFDYNSYQIKSCFKHRDKHGFSMLCSSEKSKHPCQFHLF